MLLAVEGGGLFSSSALGYSKGLTLVLLGKKTEKTPMRVTSWNQYQLVDQESNSNLHLASNKNRIIRGCASFLCFGRTAAGLDSPRPLKVGPTHHHHHHHHHQPPDVVKSLDSGKVKEKVLHLDDDDDDMNVRTTCSLRSSLRRPARTISVSVSVNSESSESEGIKHVQQKDTNGVNHKERRVQWTDVSGGDLFMIREFEPSEHSESEEEFGNGNEKSCACGLM